MMLRTCRSLAVKHAGPNASGMEGRRETQESPKLSGLNIPRWEIRKYAITSMGECGIVRRLVAGTRKSPLLVHGEPGHRQDNGSAGAPDRPQRSHTFSISRSGCSPRREARFVATRLDFALLRRQHEEGYELDIVLANGIAGLEVLEGCNTSVGAHKSTQWHEPPRKGVQRAGVRQRRGPCRADKSFRKNLGKLVERRRGREQRCGFLA